MAQQINLLTPILLKPTRQFTAAAMAQALLLILIGSLLLAAWVSSRAGQRRAEFQRSLQAMQAEQQALSQGLAGLPAATDLKAIEAQIKLLRDQQQGQAELLLGLRSGQQPQGQRHSDLLGLLARTVPASVWLQSLRWQSGQLEISGGALDPAALRGWLAQLQTQALLRRIALTELKLEMVSAAGTPRTGEGNLAGQLQLPAGVLAPGQAIWAFQARGADPAAAASAVTGERP